MTTKNPLSWKPVRRGRIYCAPACGMGCTVQAFRSVHRSANTLAKKMGKGWKPYVWENMGWHYSVVIDKCAVHPPHSQGQTYWASVYVATQFTARHKDPRKAFKIALAAADLEFESVKASRANLAKVLGV